LALDRQVELAMDAMQASHDAMLGHMALIRESIQGIGHPPDIVEEKPEGGYTEPGAKRWQGFESRFPKDVIDPEKAKGTPIEPGTEVQPETPVSPGSQVAGDVVPIQRKEPIQLWNVEKPAGFQTESPEHAGAVASGVLRGSLHILKPTPTEGK